MEDAEEDEAALEEGIDRWLVGALQLKKRPYAWPVQDPFKLGATRDTLIPKLPWLAALDLDEPGAMTWRRRIATAHPEAMLLRPGTPFVDRIERFTRWDDRGTAFVTWRTAPDWQDELWLGFQLCFVIEPTFRLLTCSHRAGPSWQPRAKRSGTSRRAPYRYTSMPTASPSTTPRCCVFWSDRIVVARTPPCTAPISTWRAAHST